MYRKRRLNGIIGIAALALATLTGIVLWQTFSQDRPGTSVQLDEVEEIRIERTEHPTLVLKANNGNWRIKEPWSLAANRQRIEPLLSALAMGGKGYAPDEVDMPATGLANPAVTLQIDATRIEIGAADISGTRHYARRDGRIVLMDDWLSSLIDGGVTALARLTPFDESLAGVQVSTAASASGQSEPYAHVTPGDWQALAARQIVAWPIEDEAPVHARATLDARMNDGRSQSYELVHTAGYVALHPADSGFSYVFANDDWPAR